MELAGFFNGLLTIEWKFRMKDRKEVLLSGIDLNKPGLEVSPLYRPTAKKMRRMFFILTIVQQKYLERNIKDMSMIR